MLVDYHFESNEDARRLAHWEEITDFVSLKVFRTKIRYFSIHKRSRVPFKVNKKVYLYLKHDQSREQQYHGTNKSFQLKFSASHS